MYVDTRRVIGEVRFHPSLWNPSCELYKDRDAKAKAWIEVCQATTEGFDDLSESEKIVIEKQIQQRWKTARDAYVRCKATLKNTKSGNKNKYVYYDRMRFLDENEEVDTEESISENQNATTNKSQSNKRLVAFDAVEDFLLPLSNISHTERVINEVRIRPALWDQSSELYKDRHAKIKAWLEIARAIAPNFDDLSDSKKKVIEKQVQQRWKTARDAYIRCKTALKRTKSKSGIKNKKKYVYYEIMQFLDKKKQLRSILSHQDTVNEPQAYSESATVDSKGYITNPTLYQSSLNDHDYELTPSTSTSQSNRISNATFETGRKIMTGKRKRISEEDNTFELEMLNLFKENMKLMQNDDMSFFCSLLPITQTFSSQQKLLFRSEVLKKAMEISNNSNSNENRPGTSHSFSSESQHSDSANVYSTEYLYVKEEEDD